MRKLIGLGILIVFLFFVASCSSSEKEDEQVTQGKENMKLEYNIDTKEWSAIMTQFGTKESLEAYAFAAEHSEVLDYMPCYCGCYENDGHINNTNCFIDSTDGNIAKLDNMGLG